MVDIVSIMVAYTIGITQSSIFLGLAYAVFDAVLVVWLRKPISRFIRRIINLGAQDEGPRDIYVANLA